MKKTEILIFVLFFISGWVFAQKPTIDYSTYSNWPSLNLKIISDDGKYVVYKKENVPTRGSTLVLQAINSKWKKEFIGVKSDNIKFTLDGKSLLFIKGKDSLAILTIASEEIKYIPHVSSFELVSLNKNEWICYQPTNKSTLVLQDLKTNVEKSYSDVIAWKFGQDGNMFLVKKSTNSGGTKQLLCHLNIGNNEVFEIFEGNRIEDLTLDDKHYQMVFKSEDSVLYYKYRSHAVICIKDANSANNDHVFSISHFSKDGKYLFILLEIGDTVKPTSATNNVEVWSYKDVNLQSAQMDNYSEESSVGVVCLANHKITRLQSKAKQLLHFPMDEKSTDTLALLEDNYSQIGQRPWNIGNKVSWSLVSIKTGKIENLNFLDGNRTVQLSPTGRFLIYYDFDSKDYFSYEILTSTVRNLTNGLTVSWVDKLWDNLPGSNYAPRSHYAWLKEDRALFVCDQFDIWKIDPLNISKPVNLTNGYGFRNHVVFHFALQDYLVKSISKKEIVILNAFNLDSKKNGFYSKAIDQLGNPKLLGMGAYIYDVINSYYLPASVHFSPIKAKKANVYVLQRMSATEAPNYYCTNDFVNFKKLSDIHPERQFNWYTTELHSWKSLHGRNLQGILYKPENFDPTRKYPIIFCYYQRTSNGLNAYLKPEPISGYMNINIPTFVSNGYLIFTPDIYYQIADPMQGTYNALVSAAEYVSKFPFVDAKKMGIQGGSFGGFETNYLITHTNLFAAAVSSSGVADLISFYNSLLGGAGAKQNFVENGQFRMGGSLWEKPDSYIRNSPIFQIDKVTTPVLMMHGKKDPASPFENAMEFFLGLQRMGKKAWMLVYPASGHGLIGKDADDFSVRMMQFFDHYLKDKPAPIWMLDGVAPSKRGLDDGLRLDSTGRTLGPGLLTPLEQRKVDSMMTRKPITIILK